MAGVTSRRGDVPERDSSPTRQRVLSMEWEAIQKLNQASIEEESNTCCACRMVASSKRKVIRCRSCKRGFCFCTTLAQQVCPTCINVLKGPLVVWKEGVLTTEYQNKVFGTSFVRVIGGALLIYAVKPDIPPPVGTWDLCHAAYLSSARPVYVKLATADQEREIQAHSVGVSFETGCVFTCALIDGQKKRDHFFIADSPAGAQIWIDGITRTIAQGAKQVSGTQHVGETEVEGPLKFLGGFKSWKSRFFVLSKGGILSFYKEPPISPLTSLCLIPLRGATRKASEDVVSVIGESLAVVILKPRPGEVDVWSQATLQAIRHAAGQKESRAPTTTEEPPPDPERRPRRSSAPDPRTASQKAHGSPESGQRRHDPTWAFKSHYTRPDVAIPTAALPALLASGAPPLFPVAGSSSGPPSPSSAGPEEKGEWKSEEKDVGIEFEERTRTRSVFPRAAPPPPPPAAAAGSAPKPDKNFQKLTESGDVMAVLSYMMNRAEQHYAHVEKELKDLKKAQQETDLTVANMHVELKDLRALVTKALADAHEKKK